MRGSAVERELTPPGWEVADWERVLLLLREWFVSKPEDWTADRLTGYALGLADFTAEQVGEALRRLRDAPGKTFLPRVSEIADAIRTECSDPSWSEAYSLMFDKPGGVIHARAPRRVHPDERLAAIDTAVLERAEQLPDLVGAFVGAIGPRRLRLWPVDDLQYGRLEIQRLHEEWDEFVERADARRREGRPLLTAPLAARRELGPRRPDYIAALGAAPTPGGAS